MEQIVKSIKEDWLLHLVLLIYVVLIFIVVLNHEQWADEAQAWLLARDSSLFGLLFKNMRYEGHPPLWHLILMLPSRLLPVPRYQYHIRTDSKRRCVCSPALLLISEDREDFASIFLLLLLSVRCRREELRSCTHVTLPDSAHLQGQGE